MIKPNQLFIYLFIFLMYYIMNYKHPSLIIVMHHCNKRNDNFAKIVKTKKNALVKRQLYVTNKNKTTISLASAKKFAQETSSLLRENKI